MTTAVSKEGTDAAASEPVEPLSLEAFVALHYRRMGENTLARFALSD